MKKRNLLGEPGTIKRRLVYLLGTGNLLLAALIWWGHQWNHFLAETVAHNQNLTQVLQDAGELETLSANSIGLPDQAVAENLERQANLLSKIQDRIQPQLHGEHPVHTDISAVFNDLKSLHAQLLDLSRRIDSAIDTQNYAKAYKALDEDIVGLHERFSAAIGQLRKLVDTHIRELSATMIGMTGDALLWLKLALALAIPASFLIGFALIGVVTKPLRLLHDSMTAIVDGNGSVSTKLPESGGEAGALAEQYNKLTATLQAALLQVAEVAYFIKHSSNQLTQNAEQTRLGLVGQNAEVQDVVDKMNAMEESVKSIGDSTSTAAAAAKDTYSKCQSSQALMSETVKTMQQLDSEAAATMHKMERMSSSVDSISMVIEVINKVAEQTNLLALNAAIEAARAGESGRGFAVVADEVRNLAIRTQQSTTEINSIIGELKDSATASQQAIDNNRKYVADALQKVDEMADALRDIDTSTREIASMTNQISDSLAHQSEFAADINRNTVNLKMTTRQAESNAKTMESLGNALDTLVDRLHFALSRFNMDESIAQLTETLRVQDLGKSGDEGTPGNAGRRQNEDGDIELF